MGSQHPAVANTLVNLATLHARKRDYAKAIPFFERTVAIYEKTLGPEDLSLALALHNLAAAQTDNGQEDKAFLLHQRALAIREKKLSANHPHVATSLHNLAAIYANRGNNARARKMYERAVAIHQKALGPDHPETAEFSRSLALLLWKMGKIGQAATYFERSDKARENHFDLTMAAESGRASRLYFAQYYADLEVIIEWMRYRPGSIERPDKFGGATLRRLHRPQRRRPDLARSGPRPKTSMTR